MPLESIPTSINMSNTEKNCDFFMPLSFDSPGQYFNTLFLGGGNVFFIMNYG